VSTGCWAGQNSLDSRCPETDLQVQWQMGQPGSSGSLFVWWSPCLGDPHRVDEWKESLGWPQWAWGCFAVHVLSVEVRAGKTDCSKGRACHLLSFQYQGHWEERPVHLGL